VWGSFGRALAFVIDPKMMSNAMRNSYWGFWRCMAYAHIGRARVYDNDIRTPLIKELWRREWFVVIHAFCCIKLFSQKPRSADVR
jgi:hypothetical protein